MFHHTIEKMHHIEESNWLFTQNGEHRGFIQPQKLSELWFHTGTNCNLRCPFCFEGAHPGNSRLQPPSLAEILPFLEEAQRFSVEKIAFTGGEPFVHKHMTDLIDAALDVAPCLILTNATDPLHATLSRLAPLKQAIHKLSFRISLDHPSAHEHDLNRGHGSFEKALDGMAQLHSLGFDVSVARQLREGSDIQAVDAAYAEHFVRKGLPENIPFVSFPDLLRPNAAPDIPSISEKCMTLYKTQEDRERFMCNYSKMIAKKHGAMQVYACTLVDDDQDYALGKTLEQAMRYRIMLRHHRCYSCFVSGTACGGG